MPRTPIDKSIPPPLRALGGWPDAEWFDPSILTGEEVVGLSLPRLPGARKLTFELAERFLAPPKPKQRSAKETAAAPACVPRGMGGLLESVGASRAAAFRKPRFFFEAPPTLYFAEIPSTNLKARASDTLRRNLVSIAFRGCVLTCGTKTVTAMFWPADEGEVTAFVREADPPHPPHIQFDRADEERPPPARSWRRAAHAATHPGKPSATPRSQRASALERDKLLSELDELRARIAQLQRQQSVTNAMETLGLDDARLKAMLLLLHPDRHGNSDAANEAAKWVNGLRDLLKAPRAASS